MNDKRLFILGSSSNGGSCVFNYPFCLVKIIIIYD